MNIVRAIESIPVQTNKKPEFPVSIIRCGDLEILRKIQEKVHEEILEQKDINEELSEKEDFSINFENLFNEVKKCRAQEQISKKKEKSNIQHHLISNKKKGWLKKIILQERRFSRIKEIQVTSYLDFKKNS